jgi:hypothetical protein
MKKIFLTVAVMTSMLFSFAQSEKYTKAMHDKVLASDTTRDPAALKELSAAFERIADAEKTQWLPYYYAALMQVNAGYFMTGGNMGGMTDKLDPIADKAEQMINKAEALSKDNAEIFIVKKMIASLRLMADPMARYQQYGPAAQQALDKAITLNPENPRIYLLEGQDKFFTPEQYGGSKSEAKKLFETALKKFDSFKPATDIDPHWGKASTEYFLSQIK